MPRHPQIAASLAEVGTSVFSALAHKMASYRGEIYPLHVGDTWLEPLEGCRMQDLRVEELPGMHRYAPPQGLPQLAEAAAARVQRNSGVTTSPTDVLITAGATGALGAVMGAILEPGDEVLIVAPYWPLIPGIVRCFHGNPVIVPLIGEADAPEGAVELLRRRLTSRSVALYLNTPNNPTGRMLPRSWIEALVAWAAREGLWIAVDEVYEDYAWGGEHVYCRALAPERTFAAHSFSKAFGMAGNRVGYVVGPAKTRAELAKVSTHAFYGASHASQLAALRVLCARGDAWIGEVRERYRELGERAAARLGVPPPEGGTFLFLDVAERLDDRGLAGFLEDAADRGLFLAPGPSFGPYPTHVRICYTSAPPDVVGRGVELLAGMLGR